jgi:hypothetical protein
MIKKSHIFQLKSQKNILISDVNYDKIKSNLSLDSNVSELMKEEVILLHSQ